MKFVNPFAPRRGPSSSNADRIKQWMRNGLDLKEDVAITVTEVRCRESGCPDLETVISIFEEGRPMRCLRVGKAVAMIGKPDIALALQIERRLPCQATDGSPRKVNVKQH
ncbi:nitrate reductase [Mesorhizobium sp. B2-4-17]|uniref:nitrate reductase n=1 Tax=Mesorhizobium sp. B2-4-17 TaxID=2589932 RepID=UPI0011294F98|nr:nitrate reductase [Mesorhizobium sp. B2-4-17]TPK92419.1 nitrate reductase [Mesorhizobium sp. B2-4-17]